MYSLAFKCAWETLWWWWCWWWWWFFVQKIILCILRVKILKYNTFPEKVAFKLVAQCNNLENGKNKFDSFFLLLPYFFLNIAFPIYIFRTYHFNRKIIVSFSIASHSIQHFSSMVNDFHLLKFQTSSKKTHCFKTNTITLITPE